MVVARITRDEETGSQFISQDRADIIPLSGRRHLLHSRHQRRQQGLEELRVPHPPAPRDGAHDLHKGRSEDLVVEPVRVALLAQRLAQRVAHLTCTNRMMIRTAMNMMPRMRLALTSHRL